MIEKPKRPKKIPNQDNKQPQTIEQLIRRYDLDNTKIYDFLDELVGSLKETQTVVSATEPTGDNREKVWIQKGKNLFNKHNAVKGYGHLDTGELTTNNNLFASADYLSVNSSEKYTFSNSSSIDRLVICEYDSSKTFLKRNIALNTSTLTITTSSTTKYVKLNSVISALDTLQLEQNSKATAYEKYIEPKIYVLNDNGVYEEFINKDDLDIYSIGETKIGTWIDGNPVYRRVINGTLSSTQDTTTIDLGEKIIPRNFFGDIYMASLKLFIPLNYSNPSAPVYTYILNSGTNTTINIVGPEFKGCDYMIVIEYIKN